MPIIDGRQKNSGTKITFRDAYNRSGNYLQRSNPAQLAQSRDRLAGASNSKYAIFAGGIYHPNDYSRPMVDAYDESLTHTTATELLTVSSSIGTCAAALNDYVIFKGITYSDVTNVYDSSLTRIVLNNGSSITSGTAIDKYAFFTGGNLNTAPVDVYDKSLTLVSSADLTITKRTYPTGTNNDAYALFAGGVYSNSYVNYVDAFNDSLTRTQCNNDISNRGSAVGASIGEYALISGGTNDGYSYLATIDAWDTSLTFTANIATLSGSKMNHAGANGVNHTVAFGGGRNRSTYYDSVDVYDKSLTRSSAALLYAVIALAAASIGQYALFAGGQNISGYSRSEVNAFDLLNGYYIDDMVIPPYSKYKFTESTEQYTTSKEEIKSYHDTANPISGYIIVNGNNNFSGKI